jgi:hypothetical protein
MKSATKTFIVIGLIVILVGLFIKYAPEHLAIMKPAPPGIHGLFSSADYNPLYNTKYDKDSLLKYLEKEGLIIKSGILNDYDPPWDSLRYLVGNIRCDTQIIEPYIEFNKEKHNGLTTFRILWINATPNESYDTTLYQTLTKKYYDCFEKILKRYEVQFK